MSKFFWINDFVCVDVRQFYKFRIEKPNLFYRIIGVLENRDNSLS